MQYWLLKSEPDVWSWNDQKKSVRKRFCIGMGLEITKQANNLKA